MIEAVNCGFKLLPHAPCSPVLASYDLHLYPKLKSHLGGHNFQSDDDDIHPAAEYLEA